MKLVLLTLIAAACARSLGESLVKHGTIYIIRHGEKLSPCGCLNWQGRQRAAALPRVFSDSAGAGFSAPGAIFAMRYGADNCERTRQTVAPLGASLGLAVNSAFSAFSYIGGSEGGNPRAAQGILRAMMAPGTRGRPVLVAWEHNNIAYLARALGVPVDRIPVWPHGDFDSVYELSYRYAFGQVELESFRVRAEGIGNGRDRAGAGGKAVLPEFQGYPCLPWADCDPRSYARDGDIAISESISAISSGGSKMHAESTKHEHQRQSLVVSLAGLRGAAQEAKKHD